jgi:elongator complex protein 3
MGVQNPNDEIYHLVGRTHSVLDVVEATRIMKDAGLKVVYHLMPGLPGSDQSKDLRMFKKIFTDPHFKPDMIKIYPCLVLKDTKAYGWYLEGTYRPYDNEEAADLIAQVKRIIPPWIRIMRVQRDIPAPLITAGVKKSNLRQLVHQRLREEGFKCRCIRCREVGHRTESDKIKCDPREVEILITRYSASEGEETFISAEDRESDILVGYLRLRVPSKKAHRPEITAETCSIVRELHVYGSLVPVGKHLAKAWQHKGYGGLLLAEAERMTRQDYNLKKILVISALGTKQYYGRFGYKYDGTYMSKILEN